MSETTELTIATLAERHAKTWLRRDSQGYRVAARSVMRIINRRDVDRTFHVGYVWKRPYAHHLNGLVSDCYLGYGDTLDAAIAMMRERTEKRERRAERNEAIA